MKQDDKFSITLSKQKAQIVAAIFCFFVVFALIVRCHTNYCINREQEIKRLINFAVSKNPDNKSLFTKKYLEDGYIDNEEYKHLQNFELSIKARQRYGLE